MTDTTSTTETVNGTVTEQTAGLVKASAEMMLKGKTSLAEVLAALAAPAPSEVTPAGPPRVPEITEAQRKALATLPEVYGKVVVTEARTLTDTELAALIEERDLIDQILAFTKKRKDESIRETLAAHFDSLVDDPDAPRDTKGHYAVKQEAPAPGTGRKATRTVSGGKPVLRTEDIERALDEGAIDRKTYLAITRKPDSPRVLDEHLLAGVVKKDPALLFTLASYAKATTPTTTIKVENDK